MKRREFLTCVVAAALAPSAVALGPSVEYDCVVVGGGTAGLSAALSLARARRSVLVCVGGPPRNAAVAHAHNLFTRDGTSPSELLSIGRSQLTPYTTVRLVRLEVEAAERLEAGGFRLRLSDGSEVKTRKLMLATGVADALSSPSGLQRCWGKNVFACPFCHGWEVRDQPWAVVVQEIAMVPVAKMCLNWTRQLVVCTHGSYAPSAEVLADFARLGVPVMRQPIAEFQEGGLVFQDGTRLARRAVLYRPAQTQRSPLAGQLGCALDSGGLVKVSGFGATSVSGVFAAGDMTTPIQSLAVAAAAGNLAGVGVVKDLAHDEFG